MKKLGILVFVLLHFTFSYSQKWFNTIGQQNRDEFSFRVTEHYDNGYMVTAGISGGYNDAHGWVIKTDINCNILWDKTIGVDPDQVLIEKTIFDEQGNLIIFGVIVQDIEPLWPLVFKLNACGELLWCKQLFFEDYEYGSFYDAIILENSDLLALANMPDATQTDMIFIFCISPDDEYKWKKSYASKANHPLFDMRLGSRI